MALNRERRKESARLTSNRVYADDMPISLQSPMFSYASTHGHVSFAFSGDVEVPQGSMVLLVGPRAQGKSTLLRLLSGNILPDVRGAGRDSGFFVPAHLRVLFASPDEHIFFNASLYQNLVMGVRNEDADADPGRVRRLCEKLGLREEVLRYLETEEALPWARVLSSTQRALLVLARALVANPEVLCVLRPTNMFNEAMSEKVLEVLREFVDQKGVEQEPQQRRQRRPRTCIFTSSRTSSAQQADFVIYVDSGSIREMKPEDVTDHMLGGVSSVQRRTSFRHCI